TAATVCHARLLSIFPILTPSQFLKRDSGRPAGKNPRAPRPDNRVRCERGRFSTGGLFRTPLLGLRLLLGRRGRWLGLPLRRRLRGGRFLRERFGRHLAFREQLLVRRFGRGGFLFGGRRGPLLGEEARERRPGLRRRLLGGAEQGDGLF